jgi:DNA polymerase elongation subunit (family B)
MGIPLRELQHCNTATVFCPLGFAASLVEELIQERKKYRRKMKNFL